MRYQFEYPDDIRAAKTALLEALDLVTGELSDNLSGILSICDGEIPEEYDLMPMVYAQEELRKQGRQDLASRLYMATWALEQELMQATYLLYE